MIYYSESFLKNNINKNHHKSRILKINVYILYENNLTIKK